MLPKLLGQREGIAKEEHDVQLDALFVCFYVLLRANEELDEAHRDHRLSYLGSAINHESPAVFCDLARGAEQTTFTMYTEFLLADAG